MHQPFYKDLWTGQYKLPWTRLHAMKDYAGMVQILEDFPTVRQTFNLVPSMIAQIEDYSTGAASDPFYDVVAIRAEDATESQRSFMLRYLFQANVEKMIFRYPRFRELYENRERPSAQDLRDLQVLSPGTRLSRRYVLRLPRRNPAPPGEGFPPVGHGQSGPS